jgi:hypothetical protein
LHSSNSYLYSILERVRGYLDEPSSKYSNDFIVRQVIMPEFVNCVSRLSLTFDNPVVVRTALSIVKNTEHYQLPPNVGELMRVAEYDDNKRLISEIIPRSEYNPHGPNWQIEGNLLTFRPLPQYDRSMEIVYIPNGDFMPHLNQGQGQLSADRKTLTLCLPSQVTLGAIDRRPNAYVGATLRLLKNTAGNSTVVEERVIDSHTLAATDAGDDKVTVRVAFDTSAYGSKTDIHYEIVPMGLQSLIQCVAAASAMNLGVMKNVSAKQMQFLTQEYRKAIKTAGDNLSHMQMRKPKSFIKDTVDNADRRMFYIR